MSFGLDLFFVSISFAFWLFFFLRLCFFCSFFITIFDNYRHFLFSLFSVLRQPIELGGFQVLFSDALGVDFDVKLYSYLSLLICFFYNYSLIFDLFSLTFFLHFRCRHLESYLERRHQHQHQDLESRHYLS